MLLRGEKALVTGAGRGVGRALALALAGEGAHLALVARTAAELEDTAQACRKHGVKAEALVQDLTDLAALPGLVERAAAALGGLSVLVNNAGVLLPAVTGEGSAVAAWQADLDLNLQVPIHLSRLVLPHLLKANRRAILNLGCFGAAPGFAGGGGVCSSKHGLKGFNHAMFEDIRCLGVKVCLLLPGILPYPGLAPDPLHLAAEDIAEAAIFALTRSPRACPTEIILRGMSPILGT